MLIDGWPDLNAVIKTRRRDSWVPFDPEFRIVKPYRRAVVTRKKPSPSKQMEMDFIDPVVKRPRVSLASQRKRAFDSFRFSLPKPVAARVETFTNRQWVLLRLFRKEPRAIDVCTGNPALTFALAHAEKFRKVRQADSLEFAATYILEKQRVLLNCLQFPDTKSAAKTLGKLVSQSIHLQNLKHLREFMVDDSRQKILSHLPRINTGVLELLSIEPIWDLLPMSLLEEVATTSVENYRGAVANAIRETTFMLEQLGRPLSPRRFSSIEKVNTDNAELSEEFSRQEAARLQNRRFPRPPVPGTDSIVPIRSELELIREGRLQQNCVASYANRVIRRSVFIYKLEDPQRCTLSIVQGPDGSWEIDQLKTKCNGNPHPSSYGHVTQWLDQYRVAV